MSLREPQHVTAIGSVTVYDAHNISLFSVSLFEIDLRPSTEPGVAAMLAPGS